MKKSSLLFSALALVMVPFIGNADRTIAVTCQYLDTSKSPAQAIPGCPSGIQTLASGTTTPVNLAVGGINNLSVGSNDGDYAEIQIPGGTRMFLTVQLNNSGNSDTQYVTVTYPAIFPVNSDAMIDCTPICEGEGPGMKMDNVKPDNNIEHVKIVLKNN